MLGVRGAGGFRLEVGYTWTMGTFSADIYMYAYTDRARV